MFSNYFRVTNLIVKFNVLSKSGLGVEIGQLCAEIQLLSHRKTGKIATSRKIEKIKILKFSYFLADFYYSILPNSAIWPN
jgi:hypothetical protein